MPVVNGIETASEEPDFARFRLNFGLSPVLIALPFQ